MAEQSISVVLASNSRLFTEGIKRILDHDELIEIVAETSKHTELNKLLKKHKPEYLFIDNRSLDCDIDKILCSKVLQTSQSKVIVFGKDNADRNKSSNLIYVNQDTDSSKLIDILKNGQSEENGDGEHIASNEEPSNITKTEHKIIRLIAFGKSNKEIAENSSISEKTVKAHITSIFMKLNLQNRYQLIVYGKRNKKRV